MCAENDDGEDVTDEKKNHGFLSARLEMDVLTDLGTPRLMSPMAKRPNFRTVNHFSASSPKPFDHRQERRFQPLLSLNDRLKRHPMEFWGVIWVSIALPSAFAIGSLTNPNAAPDAGEPQTVAAIAQNSQTQEARPPKPSPDSGQLPLWVFGAIAVGCTASCLVLAGHLKPVEMQPAEVSVEGDFAATTATVQPLEPRSQRQINSVKQPLKRLKPYEPTEALPFMQRDFVQVERSQPLQPLAVEWVTATQHLNSPYSSIDDLAAPVLVAVAPAEAEPLDWGEARLADAMDLRRRHPLHFAANNNSQS